MAKSNYQTDLPCVICGISYGGQVCYHHIKTRASGGTDEPENMIPICQKHHNEFHSKGTSHMADTYPAVKRWLLSVGWNNDNFFKKWTR